MDWFSSEDTTINTMDIVNLISDIMNQLNLSPNHYQWARHRTNNIMHFQIYTNRELMNIPSTVNFKKMRVLVEVSHPQGSEPVVFLVENTLLKQQALNRLMDFIADH